MNQEPKIDDILTLLKESLNEEKGSELSDSETGGNPSHTSAISVDDLKRKLKNQYMDRETVASSSDGQEDEMSSGELSDLLRNYEAEQVDDPSEYDLFRSSDLRAYHGKITASVFDLMLQCGCEEELDELTDANTPEDLEKEIGDSPSDRTEASDGRREKFEAESQRIRVGFTKQKIYGALRLLGMALLTLRLFFYEFFPYLGGARNGLSIFRKYPGAYVLIGLQILFLCMAFSWRRILDGIKRIFKNAPSIYSVFSVLTLGVVLYDLTLVFVSPSVMPPMFHFTLALLYLYCGIAEYCLLWRNARVLSLYSSFFEREDSSKYTLAKSEGEGSLAEKIYRSGEDYSKNIYSPKRVEYPDGFSEMFGPVSFQSPWMKRWIPVASVLCAASVIVSTLLNRGWRGNALAALSILFVFLPISAITATLVSSLIFSRRLGRRGIALTNQEAIDTCNSVDMMIFSDFHLLRACNAQNTGIYFYDQTQCAFLLSCLKHVYALIGSPVSAVFSDIPEITSIESVQIIRITQGEMEALIDKKHVLLLGDVDFMQRCGISFPTDDEEGSRVSVCVSLDGRASAKLSVHYQIEPLFEMLAERLSKEDVHSVIETFDPMISADRIAKIREHGVSPISVVHKNAEDLTRVVTRKERDRTPVGMFAYSSRLKLVEALVFCKRWRNIQRKADIVALITTIVGFASVVVGMALDRISEINQIWLLLYVAVSNAFVLILSFLMMPRSSYFTKAVFDRELQREHRRRNQIFRKRKNKKAHE